MEQKEEKINRELPSSIESSEDAGKSTDENHIRLKVIAQDNAELHFKIKRTTPLGKLMDAYCQKQGVSMSNLRFLFDGKRIPPEKTAEDLELGDEDAIDVMSEQLGGC